MIFQSILKINHAILCCDELRKVITSDVSLVLPSDSLDNNIYKSIKWNLVRLLYGKIDCIWLINW